MSNSLCKALKSSFRFAFPLMLTNLTVPLLGLIDTAVAGRFEGPQHIGAIALGGAVMSLLLWVFGFLRSGTGGLSAQAFGRRDQHDLQAILARAICFALVAGLLVMSLNQPLRQFAHILFASEGELQEQLDLYLMVRLFGSPAILMGHVVIGWFLGRQNPWLPLVYLCTATSVNGILDVYLGLYLGWGVKGIAIATVIAEYSALLVGIIALVKVNPVWLVSWQRFFMRHAWHRLIALNRDLFLRTFAMQVTFISFQALGARQSEMIIAVNGVLMNFFTLQAYALDGFADATEALSGKAVGEKNPTNLQYAVKAASINAGIFSILLTSCFLLFGSDLIALLTTDQNIRQETGHYLLYASLLPVISIWAFVFDGVFFGATRASDMRNAMFIATALFIVMAAILVPPFANHGLWLAFLGFMAIRGVLLARIYRRAGWGADFVRV